MTVKVYMYLEQKVSLPFLLIGIGLFVVTMIEPDWFTGSQRDFTRDDVRVGLWTECYTNSRGYEVCTPFNGTPAWTLGPQVLASLALAGMLATLALSLTLIFRKSRLHCLLAAFLAILSGGLGAACTAVFYLLTNMDLVAWCSCLNFASDVLVVVSGIALAVLCCRMPSQQYETINESTEDVKTSPAIFSYC